MNREQNVDKIRTACIAANPDIETAKVECLCKSHGNCPFKSHNTVGREPSLADVLLAMNEKFGKDGDADFFVGADGGLYDTVGDYESSWPNPMYKTGPRGGKKGNPIVWNLRANLYGQSDETLEFIASLV
jgi:hypothetical protein